MRLALMIMGLALAAVMGFQSFSIMTHPFANDAIASAGGTGLLAAFVAVVGAAFALQYPLATVIGFGLAALIAIATGLNSPFSDLSVWGAGLGLLAALAAFVQFKPSMAGASQVQRDTLPSATFAAGAQPSAPSVALAASSPPPAETDLYGQLERLGKLRASGALDETEFAAMKASLIAHHNATTGAP